MLGGAVWSVGDGRTIRPFIDPWIPGRYSNRLGFRPVTQAQANTKLVDWIDGSIREWKVSLIRRALSEEEATWVLVVPISMQERKDELRWPHERHGRITTRSTYHSIRSGPESSTASSGLHLQHEPNLWDSIWKAKTLPKIQVFAWKLLSNSIAVRERLVRRGMLVPIGCPICNNPETREHLIWGCAWVAAAWEEMIGIADTGTTCTTLEDRFKKRLEEQSDSREDMSYR